MSTAKQMDRDYYRGFDHGVNFVINELRRLAATGDITVEKLMLSIDPQWDDAKTNMKRLDRELHGHA